MKKDIEIMQKMIIESACNFEYLASFKSIVKENYPDLPSKKIKEKALELIEILLKKKLLDIHNIKHDAKWDVSITESISRIDKIWFEGASYVNLISTIYFKSQEWFYEELQSSGYDFTSNWIDYVNTNLWLKKLLDIDN